MARKRRKALQGHKVPERGKCVVTGVQPSMADIKACARVCSSNWFEPGAMRFFKTRLPRHAYADGRGGAYFVTSEQGPDEIRRWSIRRYNPQKCNVETIGKFQKYSSAAKATSVAKKIAAKSRATHGMGPWQPHWQRRRKVKI